MGINLQASRRWQWTDASLGRRAAQSCPGQLIDVTARTFGSHIRETECAIPAPASHRCRIRIEAFGFAQRLEVVGRYFTRTSTPA